MTAQEYKSELIEKICYEIVDSKNHSYYNVINVCKNNNYDNPKYISKLLN